jgi:alanyl-tRNA synthetase
VLEVDHDRRGTIRANHSATHLLHEALRRALGDHVAQRGSLNAPDRLRFDFSHGKALTRGDRAGRANEVNAFIRQNAPVETRIMTPDDARGIGAQALFGEKYGDEVRVVSMGTPTARQGPRRADLFDRALRRHPCAPDRRYRRLRGLGDSASSAGVRRIEALTGQAAFDYLSAQDHRMAELALEMNAQPGEVLERVRALKDERKRLENEVAQLRQQLAMSGGGAGAGARGREVNGVPFLAQTLSGVNGKDLPG